MELHSLATSISTAVTHIDAGRKGFAIEGKEREGRINYEDGIALAMTAFKEAQAAAAPQALILAEYTFLSQEFEFLEKSDKESISSLSRAVRLFDDAFLALKTVGNKSQYQNVENCIPHEREYRVKGFPMDSFHIACHSHKARLQNILKTPGLNPIEKALLKQRLANMSTAQTSYTELQRKILTS